MNIFKVLTLNKHSDYQEVLFTSTLSFLLNPKPDSETDHELKDVFLRDFLKTSNIDFPIEKGELIEVVPEKRLGNKGTVDIFIENKTKEKVIAIEAKIWDRSAKNKSKEGISQLKRYCEYLSNEYTNNWALIYLIPDENSRYCLEEFEEIPESYKNNTHLLCWNYQTAPNQKNFIETSVIRQLVNFNKTKKLNSYTKWIIESLIKIIPEIQNKIKEENRFPSMYELKDIEKTWPIFLLFFSKHNRWPNSKHTVVGIPFGKLNNKTTLHKNSLYRVRTTKTYYTQSDVKEKNLPIEEVEVEIWDDVYDVMKVKLNKWLPKVCKLLDNNGYHLDNKGNISVKILRFNELVEESVLDEFDKIMREGFNIIIERRNTCN
jgi:hypothetical protein